MQQSTRKQVPITTQRKYTIVVPDIDRQKAITSFVEQSDKSKFDVSNRNLSSGLFLVKDTLTFGWMRFQRSVVG